MANPKFKIGDKVTVKPMSVITKFSTTAATQKYIGRVGFIHNVTKSFWKARTLTKWDEYAYKVKFSDGKTVLINEKLLSRR